MTIKYAGHGDLALAYETIGPPDGEPLLLILGISQLVAWHDDFCALLVERGFQVARYDNRDIGLSTHLNHARPPGKLQLALRPSRAAHYQLADLADDAIAVLDALGWTKANLVGAAQGGMIAQSVAVRHPDRVRSLTSISASPSPKIGRPSARILLSILKIARRPVNTAEDYGEHMIELQPLTGSPGYPPDEPWLRDLARKSFERGYDQAGVQRLSAAFQAAGDRRGELAGIRVPTLVVHGDADQIVRPAGGRATAEAIPGARLVTYPGMGNDLPRPLWPQIADEIATVSRQTTGRPHHANKQGGD